MKLKLKRQRRLPVGSTVETDITGRLDRLPWSRWHWRVVTALGTSWILDGLQVTLVGAIAPVLAEPSTLNLTDTQIGAAASSYLFGAVVGALTFGRLSDALGRKRLFLVTVFVYLVATFLTALSTDYVSFSFFRALTGAGVGGEYAAINSAVDELLPARVRGRADLMINSTFWVGAALSAAGSVVLLNPHVLPHNVGWRVAFAISSTLGLGILFLRRKIPESPRWLLTHGCVGKAESIVDSIEDEVERELKRPLKEPKKKTTVEVKGIITFKEVCETLFIEHNTRAFLGLTLMVAQAFVYNALFFTYALILGRFFGVPADRVGLYMIPFAIGNFLGPMVLGRLFDTWGRRVMIALTYSVSGLLLVATGYAFCAGWLTATTQTALWCMVFFVASAASGSAYLTVSELFPIEMRGLAIALFYAAGTAIGGLGAPALFGYLIETGQRDQIFIGYVVGAALMIFAAIIDAIYGVDAEGKSLEAINRAEVLK